MRQSSDYTNTDGNLGDNEDLTEEEEVLTCRSFCTWLTGGNKRQILKSNYRTTKTFFGRKKRNKEKEPLLNPEAGQSKTAQMEFGGQNYGTLAKSSLPEEHKLQTVLQWYRNRTVSLAKAKCIG